MVARARAVLQSKSPGKSSDQLEKAASCCSTEGCTRETWNRQPGEVCCHICPKSGGRMHSADCKNFGEIVLPRWSDDESYSTSYSYEYASDEEKRRSRKQDATQNRASEKLWKYGCDFVKKRIRGNGSSTFSSLSCFVFLKYFCSSHTHTHSTFHPRN